MSKKVYEEPKNYFTNLKTGQKEERERVVLVKETLLHGVLWLSKSEMFFISRYIKKCGFDEEAIFREVDEYYFQKLKDVSTYSFNVLKGWVDRKVSYRAENDKCVNNMIKRSKS